MFDVWAEPLRHVLIYNFTLPIGLGMVGRRQLPLNTKDSTEFSLELRDKLTTSIRHDRGGDASGSDYIVHKQTSYLLRIGILIAGD
jgi:hypothetical protein